MIYEYDYLAEEIYGDSEFKNYPELLIEGVMI